MTLLKEYAYVGLRNLAGLLLVLAGLFNLANLLLPDFLYAFGIRHLLAAILHRPYAVLASAATVAVGVAILRQRARGIGLVFCAIGIVITFILLGLPHYSNFFLKLQLVPYCLAAFYLLIPRPRIRVRNPPSTPDGSNWHKWLLASLQGEGVRPVRDPFVRWALSITLLFLLLLPVSFMAVVWGGGMGRLVIGAAVLALFATLLKPLMTRMRVWQRIAAARSAEDELQRSDARRPILYLRSFALDQVPHHEHVAMRELRKLGPVIAIGRPDEEIPPLGAARFYVDHAHWQAKVTDVVKVAQLVVWATGTTEGLRWELNHLRRTLPPARLVLWAHPQLIGLWGEAIEAEWSRFLTVLGREFPVPLPSRLGATRFILFNERWEPVCVTGSGSDPQRQAAREVLAAKEHSKDARRRRAVRYVTFGILGFAVAIVALHQFRLFGFFR